SPRVTLIAVECPVFVNLARLSAALSPGAQRLPPPPRASAPPLDHATENCPSQASVRPHAHLVLAAAPRREASRSRKDDPGDFRSSPHGSVGRDMSDEQANLRRVGVAGSSRYMRDTSRRRAPSSTERAVCVLPASDREVVGNPNEQRSGR